jgi:cytochrome c
MIWTRAVAAAVTLVTTGGLAAYLENGGMSSSDGQRLFQQCSGCHSAETGERKVGPSLKGLFQRRKLRNGAPANEQSIRLKIKNGGDGMPSYDRILSAEELDHLIAYLKSL